MKTPKAQSKVQKHTHTHTHTHSRDRKALISRCVTIGKVRSKNSDLARDRIGPTSACELTALQSKSTALPYAESFFDLNRA